MHPDNIAQWLDVTTVPKHAGETMVSFGMGLDLQSDFSSLDRDAIKRIVKEAEFIDMRHLLDNTSVSRAVIGVSYIAEVVFEEPTRIAIAGTCPGWNETYERAHHAQASP